MQLPLSRLLDLLGGDRPISVRAAAVVVLGELGFRDSDMGEAIGPLIDDAASAVRLEAIRAAGKLKLAFALPRLLERVKAGGSEAEPAAHAVAALGVKGVRALQDLMHHVAPGVRKYIAAALGAAGGAGSGAADAVSVLLEKDAAVVETAVRSLIAQVPELTSSQRKHLSAQLLSLLKKQDGSLSGASESAIVRLLAALEEPKAEPIFWERLLPPHSSELRLAALQALGQLPLTPSKEQLRWLLACAGDGDFRIAASALMILKTLPVKKAQLADWLTLLQAPDTAIRQFAVERLGGQDTEEVAAALLQQLSHPDKGLREAALKRLHQLDKGWPALWDALMNADTPDHAWQMARALVPIFRPEEANRKALFNKACEYLDSGDRRADAFFHVLRETNPADLKERIEDRALALRKRKDYGGALNYLKLLTRDPACGLPWRLERACCGLKTSTRDVSPEARAADHCLEEFVSLFRHFDTELFPALEKVKWLDTEDLYYLGFHCVEQEGALKKFGGQVLQLVVERGGKTRIVQAAKSKLKSAGL